VKKDKRPNSINVLAPGLTTRRLWQFAADNGKPALEASLDLPIEKPAPAKIAGKNWTTLWQPRINVAWLSADQVFLRVVQLPQADASEIGSMLEFQLEKLSPLPVAQIVWSFEMVPSREINNLTAIVIIAARDAVEEKLGIFEAGGYQPDRLELPHIYQLLTEIPDTDGVWVYPWNEGGKEFCIAAWWFTGTLRNLQLIHLPGEGDRAGLLKDQLLKTAWAGELEGWLAFPVRWKVSAPPAATEEWRKVFDGWADSVVEVSEQPAPEVLAEFAARRIVRGEPGANLLPPEFAARYRQQFSDRLWMRGLFTAITIYAIAVLGYFLAVQFLRFRVSSVERKITSISQTYTNTLKLRERVQILQDQVNLKYAALDCLKTASDLLPTEVTLNSLVMGRGQMLELRGTSENAKAVADYNDAMRNATAAGQPLFKNVSPPNISSGFGPNTLSWAFNCELNRQEIQ
jgi:Tfp pilus assembly protein PilN